MCYFLPHYRNTSRAKTMSATKVNLEGVKEISYWRDNAFKISFCSLKILF